MIKLEPTTKKLYRDKKSEIGTKYFISRDIIYLYFDRFNVEMLINDELYKGDVHMLEQLQNDLTEALEAQKMKMKAASQAIPYKCYIFTNNIERAAGILKCSETEEVELFYAQGGKHTKNKLFKVVAKELPFILLNMNFLCLNNLENVEGEGVYKIKNTIEFNCRITDSDVHHLGQTVGRNIERMEGTLIRKSRKEDSGFYFPRLFSKKQMMNVKTEGQLVRNYNLLQCCNMAGWIMLDPEDTYKVIPNVVSFDIKTAYLSVMMIEPIFPSDLTVIDINTAPFKKTYYGKLLERTPDDIVNDIMGRIQKLTANRQWYFLSIDPNYSGADPELLNLIHTFKPFRRGFRNHPNTQLKYVNQDQVMCFLEWDIKFYNEFYSIYTEKSFPELLKQLLISFPDTHVVLMYSKSKSKYLPRAFRDEKMKLYHLKESLSKGSYQRDIVKMYTELTYGKGLQLREFETDREVKKSITNETVNIAISLTCCSYTRWRLIHDWKGFIPLYTDSDSAKFQFGTNANNLIELMNRYNELEEINKHKTRLAGIDSNIGMWQIDGLYDSMLFLAKKCYIGFRQDGTKDIKMAGCLTEVYNQFFQDKDKKYLDQIAADQKLIIPNGMRKLCVLKNMEYQYYETADVVYQKRLE